MSKVFFSYSYQDKAFVHWLVKKLKEQEIDVWYDEDEIRVGDSVSTQIDRGIKASSIFIVILSHSSLESKWVVNELNQALVYNAKKHGIKVIPVLIEKIEIPYPLNSIKYADFTKNRETALKELINVIQLSQRRLFLLPDWKNLSPQTFENLVFDLLNAEGITTIRQSTHSKDVGFDFLGYYRKRIPGNKTVEEKWIIEVKFYMHSKITIQTIAQLYGYSKLVNADVFLLVTNSKVTKSALSFISNKIRDINVLIWDEDDLADLLLKHIEIYQKYFKLKAIDGNAEVLIKDTELDRVQLMISNLKNCPEGRIGWKKYEDICIEILIYLFVPPLKHPKIQSRTESGIDIRDAIFPNRNNHENWRFIREDYDAKYILFEFKNYSTDLTGSNIDKNVVNQVRNYLKQTLGRIGFICSKKILVASGKEAQKQAYIEDKKLILFLHNHHLIDMLLKKYRNEESSDVIVDLIDEFNLSFG